MSKAFAPGESDSDEEREIARAPVLPPGTPNYMTPEGKQRLEAEHARLLARKKALGQESVENKERARSLERQLAQLAEQLNRAEVINPANQARDRVLFGAQVTLTDMQGQEQSWRIVGVDETDLNRGWISWVSPLAHALLEKKIGEAVAIGEQRLTVQTIVY